LNNKLEALNDEMTEATAERAALAKREQEDEATKSAVANTKKQQSSNEPHSTRSIKNVENGKISGKNKQQWNDVKEVAENNRDGQQKLKDDAESRRARFANEGEFLIDSPFFVDETILYTNNSANADAETIATADIKIASAINTVETADSSIEKIKSWEDSKLSGKEV